MKKLLTILTLSLLLSSCSSIHYQIGQSANAFFTANRSRHFDLVRHSSEWTVYEWTNNWSYTDPPYFFYFHYDALYQVDRGQRPPDVVIENR